MALKEPYMIKYAFDNVDLELEADPGESFLIKDIMIHNPATNYVTVSIEKTTVGYFRVGGNLGSHLPFLSGALNHSHDIRLDPTGITVAETVNSINVGGAVGDPSYPLETAIGAPTTYERVLQWTQAGYTQKTLLGMLGEKGIFKGYPVAAGETFKITGAKQAGAIQLVVYEIYDEGDQTPETENGSKSTEYMYINYGQPSADIAVAGDTLIDTAVSPAEFPAFPFGVDCPAKTEIDLLGILASDFVPARADGTNYTITDFLKLIRERVVLFDEDKNGLLLKGIGTSSLGNANVVGEGRSIIGNYSSIDCRPPFWFPAPLTFTAGEELLVYLTCLRGGTGVNIAKEDAEVALIQKVRRVV